MTALIFVFCNQARAQLQGDPSVVTAFLLPQRDRQDDRRLLSTGICRPRRQWVCYPHLVIPPVPVGIHPQDDLDQNLRITQYHFLFTL